MEYLWKAIDFCPLLKNMGKNIGKNKGQNLNGKYCQKLHDHAKNLQQMQFNCFIKAIWKTAEAMGDLIGKKSADKITKVSKSSP